MRVSGGVRVLLVLAMAIVRGARRLYTNAVIRVMCTRQIFFPYP